MNQSLYDGSNGPASALETSTQLAIQFYDKVRIQANKRLSFAPIGQNGLRDNSGHTSRHSLSEMFDGTFQRQGSVLRSLVEHGELPDAIHELSSPESSESRLAGTICTGYFVWMLAELSELIAGGDIHTVGPLIESMIPLVGQQSTALNTSPKRLPPMPSLLSTSTPEPEIPGNAVLDKVAPVFLSVRPVKKKKKKSRASTSKSRKGKKAPSAKKKRKKSTKRSGRK